MNQFLHLVWSFWPSPLQKKGSAFFAWFFQRSLSRLIIAPYCVLMGLTPTYLAQFVESQEETETQEKVIVNSYRYFQSFFLRQYKTPPVLEASIVWPCEGYICDWSTQLLGHTTKVKGQVLPTVKVFGARTEIPQEHSFYNVFLHNHNYHRIHAPVSGTVESVERIAGGLNFLRPWFYRRDEVSAPSLRNERVVLRIRDERQRPWLIALVGGFGVGTIELKPETYIGAQVEVGQELGHFALGSTVCLLAPYKSIQAPNYLQTVQVGQALPLRFFIDKVTSNKATFSVLDREGTRA